MKLAKHHQRSKQRHRNIYFGRPTTMHNPLFCIHTPRMNYVIKRFPLLVSFSVRVNNSVLCFVYHQDQKREQKHT